MGWWGLQWYLGQRSPHDTPVLLGSEGQTLCPLVPHLAPYLAMTKGSWHL